MMHASKPALMAALLLLAACKEQRAPTAQDATMQEGITASVEDVEAAAAAQRGPAPADNDNTGAGTKGAGTKGTGTKGTGK